MDQRSEPEGNVLDETIQSCGTSDDTKAPRKKVGNQAGDTECGH